MHKTPPKGKHDVEYTDMWKKAKWPSNNKNRCEQKCKNGKKAGRSHVKAGYIHVYIYIIYENSTHWLL